MSELALKLITENKRNKSKTLDLSNCGMSAIPEELTELIWLEKLVIAGESYYDYEKRGFMKTENKGEENSFSRLPAKFENLTLLRKLVIVGPRFRGLPFSDVHPIARLYSLVYLDIESALLTDLKALEQLSSLQWLSFSSNQVSSLEPLKGMSSLQWLSFSSNQVSSLEPLKGMSSLQWLSFSSNQVSSLEPLKGMSSLQWLFFSSNHVSSLEPLKGMSSLQWLFFSSNQISSLEPLEGMSRLIELSFDSNQVSSLKPLRDMSSLQSLSFSSNQVSSLEPLEGMGRLQTLSFSSNQISSLEPLKDMRGLQNLYFNSNQVSSLEPLESLPSLYIFSCKDNPIEDCPADVYAEGDIKAVRAYFEAKKTQASVALDRDIIVGKPIKLKTKKGREVDLRRDVKLIILGNSSAGKTNLVNYLETGRFTGQRDTTHGLEVHRWLPDPKRFPSLGDVAVSIWDFGGQEYYHDTYRLFLNSDNAVYLVLWCTDTNKNGRCPMLLRKGEEKKDLEHFEYSYWLDTVRHYGNKNGKTALLMVQNKIDLPDTEDKDPKLPVDPAQPGKKRIPQNLHNEYKILDSFHISLQEGSKEKNTRPYKTLQHFLFELESVIAARADMEGLPPNWQVIRNEILLLKEKQTGNKFREHLKHDLWIGKKDFSAVCKDLADGQLTDAQVDVLPELLHNGGVVVFFKEVPELNDRIFIRPDALATKIYEVLNDEVLKNSGVFSADNILKHESVEYKKTFLLIAEQLDIIFPHPVREERGKNLYLAPQYLPDSHPIEELFQIASKDAWHNGLWVKVPLFYYKKILHGLLLHYAGDEKTECRYFWKHGIMFLTKETPTSAPVRVLIKGLYPNEDEHDGVLLIGIEEAGQSTQLLQRQIFTKMLGILTGKSEERNKEDPHKELRREIRRQATLDEIQPEIISLEKMAKNLDIDVFASYDGENYVSYKKLLGTTEPKVLSDPEVKKKIKPSTIGNGKIDDSKGQPIWLLTKKFEAILDRSPQRAKKVFLSYSHQNTKWLSRLRAHLSGLRRAKEIETWDDREILPGDQWDASIKKQLDEADVYILLLSADFIASEYIWEKELRVAIENYNKRKADIIPVLLEPLDMSAIPKISQSADGKTFQIGHFEIIPKNKEEHLQAVSLWQNQEEALARVAERIRLAITGKNIGE